MRLRVVALDYDGTLADHGVLHPDVPAALHEARARGLYVVLVTGRRVDDLRRVLGDLGLFDAVVAENGAVVTFPDAGPTRRLAPRIQASFVHALRAAGVADALPGECLVEMDARSAPTVLEVVRRSELALALHFNRGRLMVLPVAVSKATGLREVLRHVRLSVHNAAGIGDAENDQELLSVCELGAAVSWGSPVLRAAADHVVHGEGPGAVAEQVRAWARAGHLDLAPRPRRAVLLGREGSGEPVWLDAGSRDVLVTGEAGSGKSWLAGLICEHLILLGYTVCVLDPAGRHGGLEALPGVVVLGEDGPPPPEVLRGLLRHADTSVVVQLSRLPEAERLRYVATVLPMLADLRRRTGLPHRVVVDDAHAFLRSDEQALGIDPEPGGHVIVSHPASGLHPQILLGARCVLATRCRQRSEVHLLHRTAGADEPVEHWERTLAGLGLGEVVILPPAPESGGRALKVRLTPRLPHTGRRLGARADRTVDDARAFRFVAEDGTPGPHARSVRELVEVVARAPSGGLAGHLRRGDLSRWVGTALGDAALAAALHEVEARFGHGLVEDPVGAVLHAMREREG